MTVDFELDGQPYTGINGGPLFIFDEAMSLLINCADQAEVDYYWDKLTDGRRGVAVRLAEGSFRVVVAGRSAGMEALFTDPDPTSAERAMQAMLGHEEVRHRRDDWRRPTEPD